MVSVTCMHLQLNTKYKGLKEDTVKPVLSSHSKRRPKIGFQDPFLLNAGQSIAECSKGSILKYFRPSLSYHLS